MIKFEEIKIPGASLGDTNPMPDIKNISYIHAGFKMTDAISEEEKKYIGVGTISTMLPYRIQDNYDRNKKIRSFKGAVLENEHLRAVFLPELGGRLWSLFDKDENRDLLYVNPVFQPGNLALRNAWFSGGVEFNVGIKGHNPLTCSPLWCAVDKTQEGDILRLYEFERIRGVVYSISAWLPDDSKVLYINCKIENKSDEEKHMYWWSNIAVPETPHTRIFVPAKDSLYSYYNEDHYLVDKIPIPEYKNIDVSYPENIPSSRDFFYNIDKNEKKWIATADRQGKGLLQCSTKKLIGRKLFVWGQGAGGRNWNEWLSKENSAYIEIQAGLAPTQLEHIPMPAGATWEWTEAYTAFSGDPDALHGDYKKGVDTVREYMKTRIGDPDALTFPVCSQATESKIVYRGSNWGACEELARGKRISDSFEFPYKEDEETKKWHQLICDNTFPEPSVQEDPGSYVCGNFFIEKLRALPKQSWFSLLHLGVVLYASGDLKGAEKAWRKSIEKEPSPWAYRNLSMLYKNEYNNLTESRKYILLAFNLKKDCRALCFEVGLQLINDGGDEMWLSIYDNLPEKIRKIGRIRLYKAIALIHLSRLDEATKIINKDFVMEDIKEGEISISHIWFELYHRVYAHETGVEFDVSDKSLAKAADEKYPLPKRLDFRMH